VYDLNGRRVKVPSFALEKEEQARWDGRDEVGHRAQAGIYFVLLKDERSAVLKKVALLP
jgi:hypothetical protein